MPASPPMRTKSTSCSRSFRRIAFASNLAGSRDATIPCHEVRKRDAVIDPLRDRSPQILLEQRHVVPVVDWPRLERELLAEQVEQVGERVDRGGDEVALDPRDRRLRRSRSVGQLLLREPVPKPCFLEELSCPHSVGISDQMCAVCGLAAALSNARLGA